MLLPSKTKSEPSDERLDSFCKNVANRVLYVQYTNPAGYPPLEHSSRILANAGWQVLFLGIAIRYTEDLHFPKNNNIRVRQLSSSPPGWRQRIHYLRFALWTFFWAAWWRPNWVYASDIYACPIALLLARIPGVNVLYHEHDSPTNMGSMLHRICWKARSQLARRARLCVLPNEQRMERFSRETGRQNRLVCVWNCPARDEVAPPRSLPEADAFWLLYHGSINRSRLPGTVIEALAKLPPNVKLRIIGYETLGSRGYLAWLRKVAQQNGVEDRVQFVGIVPHRQQLLELCTGCHVGISFMPQVSNDVNERHMTGASNKPFDYLARGLPLLVADRPDWKSMFVDPGYGLPCDPLDPESIANVVGWFYDHLGETCAMGEQGRYRIAEEWNYETQFAPVLNLMKDNAR